MLGRSTKRNERRPVLMPPEGDVHLVHQGRSEPPPGPNNQKNAEIGVPLVEFRSFGRLEIQYCLDEGSALRRNTPNWSCLGCFLPFVCAFRNSRLLKLRSLTRGAPKLGKTGVYRGSVGLGRLGVGGMDLEGARRSRSPHKNTPPNSAGYLIAVFESA